MMNWAVGREYIDRTPFRRGTETLIRKLREDNQRTATNLRRRGSTAARGQRRRSSAPMIIAAFDTGMRHGEMLALRFADIDSNAGLITLRGETTKNRADSARADRDAATSCVLEWLRFDA